jgi:putative ABC transport system permease protein
MFDDLRYAFRQFRKNPGFTTVAVLTLALGIGAAVAMFSLIQGVLLSPPPYANPDRVVLISPARIDGRPYSQGSTIGQWVAWRAASTTLDAPALYRWTFNFLVLPDGSVSLGGMVVTKDYFRILGLKPLLGREFLDTEAARPKTPPTAIILGYELWKRQFNGDPHIIGTAIKISRMPAPLPVVGVMPPGVRFLPDPGNASEPNYDVNAHVDFWLAIQPDESQPKAGGWNAVSRLREGTALTHAQAEVAAIASRQIQADTDLEGLTATVQPVQEELNRDGRRLLVPLFGSVALLFFIVCGNVAGLLLARGLQRQLEYALRSVLGARPSRLFRQVLVESVALALVGALFGAGLATGIVRILKAIGGHAVPRVDAVTVGWRVLAFGLLAALLAATFAGLLPAVRAALPERFRGLKGTRSSAGRAERRLLSAVATLQVVLTVALLAGAALLIRTAANLARVRPGYDTENILAMTVTTVQRDQWKAFHTQALERVAALPGVKHAAFVWGLPLTGNKWTDDMQIVGEPGSTKLTDQLRLPLRSVTPDYFDTLGIGIIDGRGFRSSDDDKAPRVAVINESLARRGFHGSNPIGRKMRFADDTSNRTIEIVGVVSDTRTEALNERAEPEIYFCFWQNGAFSKHLVLRTTSEPRALAALVRRELRTVDPTSAVEHITTMEEIRLESVASRTFAMRLLTAFSLAATSLALVGLYGVLSLSVGSRTKEIAVRKAVGAQRHEILRLILGEGSRLIALGLALGTAVAVLVGHLLGALLFDVQPGDPLVLAGAAVLFGVVALAACSLPAVRAARVDLMEALRQE